VTSDELVVVLQVGARLRREAGGERIRQVQIEGDQPAGGRVVLRGIGVPQKRLADAVALAALVAVLEREVHGDRREGVKSRLSLDKEDVPRGPEACWQKTQLQAAVIGRDELRLRGGLCSARLPFQPSEAAHPAACELVQALLVVLPPGEGRVTFEHGAPRLCEPHRGRNRLHQEEPGVELGAPAVARLLERAGVSERVRRRTEAVGVEQQLGTRLKLQPEVRQRVAQEDHVDVCEKEGGVEREQISREARLGAPHLREARRAPLGLFRTDRRVEREARRARAAQQARRTAVGGADERAGAQPRRRHVRQPVECEVDLRRVDEGDQQQVQVVGRRRSAHERRPERLATAGRQWVRIAATAAAVSSRSTHARQRSGRSPRLLQHGVQWRHVNQAGRTRSRGGGLPHHGDSLVAGCEPDAHEEEERTS